VVGQDINSHSYNKPSATLCQASRSSATDSPPLLDSYKANAVNPLQLCRYVAWKWLNEETGELRDFNCGSWRCPVCSQKVAWRWACRVAIAKPERMVTLTNVPSDKIKAYFAFGNLLKDIRQHYDFEYIRFLATGSKTGMLHWHIAQRGDFIPVRWLSRRAYSHGLGEIVDIRKCYGSGPQFYLTDYITREPAPAGWRKVSVSRGFPKSESKSKSAENWQLKKGAISNV